MVAQDASNGIEHKRSDADPDGDDGEARQLVDDESDEEECPAP
jgi:hypothetical protein